MGVLEELKEHTRQLPKQSGKKPKFVCDFCDNEFTGITRIVTHFAGVKGKPGAEAQACRAVPAEVRAAALKHLGMSSGKRPADDDDGADADDEIQEVVLRSSKQSRASVGSSTSMQSQITAYTVVLKHEAAQEAVLNLFLECGVPFNVMRHPAWFEMWESVRKAGPNFRPLSYNTCRTTGLTKVSELL